jgi:hypothetical protein
MRKEEKETTGDHENITQTILTHVNVTESQKQGVCIQVCVQEGMFGVSKQSGRQPQRLTHSLSLVSVQATQHTACGTQLPLSFVGVGNGALWAVNGTLQSFGAGLRTCN